ncbi:MAG: AAA family ATPase, partial [Thermoflexibacteraceae bacterium]
YKGKVNGEVGSGDRNIILNRKKFFNTLIIAFVQDAGKYNSIADIPSSSPTVLDLLPMIRKTGQDTMMSLTNWLYYYVHEKNTTQPIEKLFSILSKIIGEEISLKQPYKTEAVVGNALGDINIVLNTPQNPEGIHLNLVSQGYNNLFRWVGGILMRVYEYQQNFFPEIALEKISGIVLIDEIDTYLHPKWQRNILKVLVEEFPKLQFVVTTHSPLVVRTLDRAKVDWSLQVIAPNLSETDRASKNNYEPYSALLNVESEILFGIPQREPDIQEAFNAIFLKISKLNKNTLETELIDKEISAAIEALKKRLHEQDPDIIRAEISLKTKLINLQNAAHS